MLNSVLGNRAATLLVLLPSLFFSLGFQQADQASERNGEVFVNNDLARTFRMLAQGPTPHKDGLAVAY